MKSRVEKLNIYVSNKFFKFTFEYWGKLNMNINVELRNQQTTLNNIENVENY